MSHSSGLSFKRIDLHVHTPASTDYQGTKPTADQIVQKALAVGLSAIAITDHQTAASVDQVIAAGKAAGLVVFPGVELMATGGEKGIHINLLFDVDKNSEWIHQFLNSIEVYSKDGKPTVIAAEYSVGKIADKLAIYDPTALIVLAHCHSSKGVLGDMKGETRSMIFQKHRKNILAAETSEDNFTDDDKRKLHKRVIDVLDGTDKDYFYRKLGVIQASDAHSLDAIGSAFSWFKVDNPITIEDLRQCFIDRDTRIRQGFEFTPTAYPHIESLAITDGFLKDQTFTFHEGLNSILGAKGSGKSLAIEALRFALDQAPTVSPIREDHQAKLAKCVKPYGAVIVTLLDESGKQYRIKRTYNPTESHPTEITDVSDGTKKAFSVPEVFPVLFLSQNEIIRIAEEPSGSSLRTFIDRFFDFHHHQHQIEQILKELEAVDRRVADGMRAHLGSAAAARKAATLKEEIEKLNRQLTNPTFEKFAQAEAIGLGLRVHGEFVAGLETSLTELDQTLAQETLPATEQPVSDDPGIKRARDAAEGALKAAQQQLQQAKAALEGPRNAINGEIRTWEVAFAPIKQEYESLVKAAGGGQGALDQRRRKLVLDLAAIERQITAATTKIQLLRTDSIARQEILTRLDQAYTAYFNERSERCKFFTTQAHGSIDVSIAQGRDVSQFRDKLLGLKKGTYMREDEIDQMVQTVTPRELVGAALRYEYLGRLDKKPLNDLAQQKKVKPESLERLVEHILDSMPLEQLLALVYETTPQDVPEIRYEVAGAMKPLAELSVGQKASALLIVGLSDGRFPIIIDQPEDSLDLRSIWEDVCKSLRDSKDRRQFIFTTHNSSVAVASDSDKFTILQAGATQATVVHSGSINSPDVKKEVIAYLEGGPDTYEKKRAKYNLEHREPSDNK